MRELIFDIYSRQSSMDSAHKKALECERALEAEVRSLGPSEFEALQTQALEELNGSCGHIDKMIRASGRMIFNGINLGKGITADRQYAHRIEHWITVHSVTARSLGYAALLNDPGKVGKSVTIMHRAFADPHPVYKTEVGTVYQDGYLAIPLDGSADVQLKDEKMPPNLEMLDQYVPDILDDIDVALNANEGLTERLRSLGEIDFASSAVLTGRGGADLKDQITAYINAKLDIELQGICYIAGTEDIAAPTDKGHTLKRLENFGSAAVLRDIQFSPIDHRLILIADVSFHRRGLQQVSYVLNPRITIAPIPGRLIK